MATKTRGNVTVTYNSNALTAHLNSTSVEAVVNAIETTHFSSTGAEKIAGTGNWTVNVGGDWSSTLSGYLTPDAVSPPATLRTMVVVIGGVTYTWTSSSTVGAFIGNLTVDASDPNTKITWKATLEVSGAPVVS
jgi:hypothetical protein